MLGGRARLILTMWDTKMYIFMCKPLWPKLPCGGHLRVDRLGAGFMRILVNINVDRRCICMCNSIFLRGRDNYLSLIWWKPLDGLMHAVCRLQDANCSQEKNGDFLSKKKTTYWRLWIWMDYCTKLKAEGRGACRVQNLKRANISECSHP